MSIAEAKIQSGSYLMATGNQQNQIVIYEVLDSFLVKETTGWDMSQMRLPTAMIAIAFVFVYQVYIKDWSSKDQGP